MPKYNRRPVFMLLAGLLIALVVVVVAMLSYVWGSNRAGGKLTLQNFNSMVVQKRVQIFYNDYTLIAEGGAGEGLTKSELFDRSVSERARQNLSTVTDGVDPVLCARTAPRVMQVNLPDLSQTPATVDVRGTYLDGTNTSIRVSFDLAAGKIIGITCLASGK